jgi:thioredoxin 1
MEIKSFELQEKIKNGEEMIVDFHTQWCFLCKLIKPIFEIISNKNTTEVGMYTMDVDSNREIAIELGIRSVPTIKLFNTGEVVETKAGVLSEEQIKDLVTELING